ncbi:MAG TPA: thymidine phosphorylase [Synergistales bacterium]|jgi:pyrimidine-nucleoside phosphorylase|nr:thymidine phosphorylase [Synergistales bacterium]MDD3830680.1 thymidine phosphorylase [Synergistales bacterium]HOI80966.1 thymidine phosphorylase [Synergistales bacterium]HRW87999.1 thymidine phosphorylase [Thermovirgaceae bacterium]
MNPVAFIESKRDGNEATTSEIRDFVNLAHKGEIPEYQVAAWLMAVFFRGMSGMETRTFTEALSRSGRVINFPPDINPVDKHSTGGVGDKTSLVVVPLAAACGVPVAKLSGRGLGFTGGTVDKLESIPGFSAHLEMGRFIDQVRSTGCAISGHSGDLAPAEALFYELRDVTGTIPSIPLITSSIVSKKMAGGSRAFVFDVKCGSGAFMEDQLSARELAESLVDLSASMGRGSMALITDMSQPLGMWVGNAAEVAEAVDLLLGRGPDDLRELSLRLTASMVHLGRPSISLDEALSLAERSLEEGKGFRKFEEMVRSQGGDLDRFQERVSRGEHLSRTIREISAAESGILTRCDARRVGDAVRFLGGGRLSKKDAVDHGVSCQILRKIGDAVSAEEPLARVFFSGEGVRWEEARAGLVSAFEIGESVTPPKLLLGSVGPREVD